MKKLVRLKDHPYAQCGVILEDNGIFFVSYKTPVIWCNNKDGAPGTRTFNCSGLYSATTRKQIGYFLKEYFPDLCYHDIKAIAGQGGVLL